MLRLICSRRLSAPSSLCRALHALPRQEAHASGQRVPVIKPASVPRFDAAQLWGARRLAGPTITRQQNVLPREVKAAAAGPSVQDRGRPEPLHPSNTQGHRLPLFLVYSSLGAGLTFGAGSHLESSVALALTSSTWLGFVLAISMTEAWVKFRAPMLDRHVAVDVGRHVFGALNSVEAALALTTLMMTWHYGLVDATHLVIPGVLAATVALQVVWLTPALSLRAQHLIASSANPEMLSPRQQAALAGIQRVCAEKPQPPAWLHRVYGVVEISKVVLLGVYVWQLVGV